MEFLYRQIRKILEFQKNKKSWWKVVRFLECITVFVTTYALILPAISLSQDTARQQDGIVLEESVDTVQEAAASGNDISASSEQAEYDIEGSIQSSDDAVQEEAVDAAALTGTVYPKSLDLRSEKRMDADAILVIPQETVVTVLEDQGDGWLLISTPDGWSGYVKAAEIFLPDEKVEEKRPKMTFELIADRNSPDAEISEAFINGTFSDPIKVHVEAPVGAFPAGTTMKVRPIAEEQIREAVESVVPNPESVSHVSAVEITFFDVWGDEIEPDAEIKVSLTSTSIPTDQEPVVVHVDDKGQAEMVEAKKEEEKVVFESDKFSVYAVIETVIEKSVLASDGQNYKVSVAYGPDAGVPEGVELAVDEITEESPVSRENDGSYENAMEYGTYLGKIREALELDEAASFEYIRLFDIRIVDGNGQKIEITAPVEVKIELADKEESQELNVVHFADGNETGDVLEGIEITGVERFNEGSAVSFEADGFSVYAIVEEQEPVETEIKYVTSLDELTEGTAFLLSYDNLKHYFTNELNGSSCFIETGSFDDASEWFFENADSDGKYYLCTYVNGQKKYLKNTSGNLVGLSDSPETVLELSPAGDTGKFHIKLDGENKWLQHSKGGGGIRFWTDNNNAANSKISFTYASSYHMEKDPYKLDGKTYGIAFHNESSTAAALTSDAIMVSGQDRLAGLDMLMRPDILDNEGVLLVASNSDITEWTFHSISEDRYYITASVGGEQKYLKIDKGKVVLTGNQEEASAITATPGTGSNSGKWHFTANGYSLNYSGSANNGFNGATGSGANTWMNLVEKSELTDEDFVSYTARKVSVSDTEQVPDGAKVILYTRIWNDTTKRYEFYAVDHDGSLIRCYESGDVIEWIGGSINTAVWDFTDYKTDGVSTYYYELKNDYSGKYIAPQLENGQVLSDNTIGINMNGRRYGDDYTTIISWDDRYYEYAGLRTEDNHVVSCPLAQAEDFYFAIVEPQAEEHPLTEVATIDSDAYGISMKMIDFKNPIVSDRDSVQTQFFGRDSNITGLLTSDIKEETGYPVSTHNQTSLGELFSGAQPVNHLFIASKYSESGYFEYDSTQNAAYLNEDGTFTVYDQLVAVEKNSGPTRTHGQFMPYNEIDQNIIAPYTNQTDVLAKPLPDTDPRKGEEMFWVSGQDADYFFGMEMEASFTQTASGLDAWGHDIIFEFSGDDDFWLYVDGELVLDLGGVHPAMTGSINFRTGQITSSRGNSTLYEVFKENYQSRGMSEDEINNKLDEIFTMNSNGQYVFKDYTNHTMKMYYMERGAGASNLHMRFNLAAVKPGTVVLSKSISGTDKQDYKLAEFPYQIYYRTEADGGTQEHLLGEKNGDDYNVTYAGKSVPVRYEEEYKPAGGSTSYQDVFFLKPGQSAEISLPEGTLEYRIVECGINPSIYDKVTANDTELNGADEDGDGREDYAVGWETMKDRPKVDYDNHVDPDALRTLKITKKLYDANGTLLSREDDPTGFSFRLYLGMESDETPPLADMHEYHVMNEQGFYCKWDEPSQSFISLGKSNWEEISAEDKAKATFTTSSNGSVSKIPAGYSIVVRELVVGSKFMVEERESEIPPGYTLRETDGYCRVEGSYITEQGESANAGIIRDNSDPEIEVRNQRGWGLTVRKIWSDADYMESHDPIQFAVFMENVENDDTTLTMVPDSLKTLESGSETVYWYYDALAEGKTFNQYVIREVVADDSGVRIIGQGDPLVVNGKQQGESVYKEYTYSASYTQGSPTGATAELQNVRTDTVTNARSGIEIRKTKWDGTPLAGADFVLKDADGKVIGQEKYTSDAEGLVTVAYLAKGVYTLSETGIPKGYQGLPGTLTINVNGSVVSIDGEESVLEMCELIVPGQDGSETGASDMPVITVKNKEMVLRAIKTGENQAPLSGAKFALYRQVRDGDGNLRKDYQPMSGYDDLVTDDNGVIPKITQDLAPGTYYLTEREAPEEYQLLTADILFTISSTGTVSIAENQGQLCTLASEVEEGRVTYTLTVINSKSIGYELPDCGGSGTNLIYLLGIMLTGLAGAGLMMQKRKKAA